MRDPQLGISTAKELENAASRYANEAIRFDSQGARGMAIQMYQKAIANLIQLAKLYPNYELNQIYLQRAKVYQERVKALQSLGKDGQAQQQETEGEQPKRERTGVVEPLKASFNELVIKEKPKVKWEEVVGLEEAKRIIRECIVFPVQRPDLFPLGWPRGILLYGPPGSGKTLLAAATAAEIDAYFVHIDAASIMSKWLGEAEKNVAKLFSWARRMQSRSPVIIFIDELDSLLGTRSQEIGGEVRVRNQFLKEMDGLGEKGKRHHIYVIGATNKPWSLDWPFLRRFEKRIYVPLPDLKARIEMLKLYSRPLRLSKNVNMEEIARLMEGYSGSDVKDVCQAVQLRVVSELFESGKAKDGNSQPREITQNDFREILRNRRPSISAQMIRAYQSWSDGFKAL